MELSVFTVMSFAIEGLAPPGVLFEQESEGKRARLSVGPASMTVLEIFELEDQVFHFQPIFFKFNVRFILSIIVGNDVNVHINGKPLSRAEITLLPFFLSGGNEAYEEESLISKYQAINEKGFPMMERRFIQKIKKIEKSLIEGGEPNIIEACGSLRIFLLDNFLDKVNQNYRVRIRFKVPKDRSAPPIEGALFHVRRSYDRFQRNSCKEMTKEKFLKACFVYVKGECVTVRQLVRLAANYLGIHHYGDPDDVTSFEGEVFGQYDQIKINEEPALLITMKDISQNFIDSIEPLVEAIIEDQNIRGAAKSR